MNADSRITCSAPTLCKQAIRRLPAFTHSLALLYFPCPYSSSFIQSGRLHIVMEYADGGDLFNAITQKAKTNTLFAEDTVMSW